jgi:hypothetical protein
LNCIVKEYSISIRSYHINKTSSKKDNEISGRNRPWRSQDY